MFMTLKSFLCCSRQPKVMWTEGEDKIYLTVLLADAKISKVKVDYDGTFTFSAAGEDDNNLYELKLELLHEINVEECKINMGTHKIFCVLEKAEKKRWMKLLRGNDKTPQYVKLDWGKLVDEDEEDTGAADDKNSDEDCDNDEDVSIDDVSEPEEDDPLHQVILPSVPVIDRMLFLGPNYLAKLTKFWDNEICRSLVPDADCLLVADELGVTYRMSVETDFYNTGNFRYCLVDGWFDFVGNRGCENGFVSFERTGTHITVCV